MEGAIHPSTKMVCWFEYQNTISITAVDLPLLQETSESEDKLRRFWYGLQLTLVHQRVFSFASCLRTSFA